MDFIAFLLVNAMLFLRPEEIVPELGSARLYYFSMLACLVLSIPPLIRLFFYSPLIKHPTAIFTFLMLCFAGFSLAVTAPDLGTAAEEEIEFAKIVVYFCLFLAIVRTPARLKGVIVCVSLCMTVTAVLGVLHYYDVINISTLKLQETYVENRNGGIEEIVRRLRFTGILHDPNEVAVFLSMLTFLCAYQLTNKQFGAARFLWLVPIGVFLFSIFLTKSRGGLLSLLAGMTVFALYGFRPKDAYSNLAAGRRGRAPVKGMLFLAVSVPVLLIAVGGRQTDISTNAGTVQTRFGLWSDWLQEFRHHPVVGVGPIIKSQEAAGEAAGNYVVTKHCAHNSYLQPFADMGFFGGLCFLGAVGAGLLTLHRYGFEKTMIYDNDLRRLQPYLMAALACVALGFLTLTLNYVLPTFFVLALPVAYYGMTPCYPPIERPSLSVESLVRLGVAGVGFLAFTYVMVLVMPKQ